jgi:hypothetical protein
LERYICDYYGLEGLAKMIPETQKMADDNKQIKIKERTEAILLKNTYRNLLESYFEGITGI